MDKKVAMIGASGRMGQEICQLFSGIDGWTVSQKVGSGEGYISSLEGLDPDTIDVVIDFSNISLFDQVLSWCVTNKKPLVTGTTGLNDVHMRRLTEIGQKIPLLWSANMSLGIAWLSEVIKQLEPLASSFDFQIEELHHRHKLDSPSGTAKHLQRVLTANVDGSAPEPVSIRGGGIFGVHKIWAMSDDEVITLEHQALNRTVFARGAVKAAMWLVDKGPGQYTISSLLEKDSDEQ